MNTIDYAHNDYLQVLAELGLPRFLAGLLFVFNLIHRSFRSAILAPSPDRRYLAVACIAGITAMLLHSLVDFNMYVPATATAPVAWRKHQVQN